MDRCDLLQRSSAELADGIGQLHALNASLHRAQLELVAAYAEKEFWRDDGATSMTAWLAMALGLAQDSAAEWVRVAKAFDELPAIASAYEEGRLSWDQVRAVTRFATPENDEFVAADATRFSAAHLRRMARRHRSISAEEDEENHRRRELRLRWNYEAGILTLSGQLPAAEGSVVAKALESIAMQAPPDPVSDLYESYDVRCADALVELASTHLTHQADGERATVVVHVDGGVLAGARGNGELEDGAVVPGETVRRLACDAKWLIVADGPDGLPLGIGRTSRKVPTWLVRELRRRDGGCRFPGCERTRWLVAHHLVHWANGGPTDMDNLVMLCGPHHRMVHEGAVRVSGDPSGDLCFIRPDGRVLSAGPPRLRPEVRERVRSVPAIVAGLPP